MSVGKVTVMRLQHVVFLLGLNHCSFADDLDAIVARDISAVQRGELYERLTKVEFAPIAAKLARLKGHYPILTGIGPQTRQPWSESGLSEGDKIGCTLHQLWEHHLDAARQRGDSVQIMLSVLDDPIFQPGVGAALPDFPLRGFDDRFDGRLSALSVIQSELIVSRGKLPQALRERILKRLDQMVQDAAQPAALRERAIGMLSAHGDPNEYLELAIQLSSKERTPVRQGGAFRLLTPGARRLTAENQKRWLHHAYSLLEKIDDGRSGEGYDLALTIGSVLGIRPVRDLQGAFAPDSSLSKYQGKNGLTHSFFQDTVNNARKWWSENQSRY